MPAGLDGNPDPIATPDRDAVVFGLVQRVESIAADRRLVGIDGAPGTGKSTLGDELAVGLRDAGHHVVRSTIDSFHRPRTKRRRAASWDAYLHDGLPDDPVDRQAELDRRLARARWPRYHDGWQLYLDGVDPLSRATVVVDNDDLGHPLLVTGG